MKDKKPDGLTESERERLTASIAERTARRRAVNWDKWPNLPELRVWQAVALSLGVEPSAVFLTGLADEYGIALEGQEFKDRLQVAAANLAGGYEDDRGPLPDVGALPVLREGTFSRANAWTSTNAFRSWAASIGWTLPKEFAPEATKLGDVSNPTFTDPAPAPSGDTSRKTRADANQAVRLQMGMNSRESIGAYIGERSRQLYVDDTSLSKESIATIIAAELKNKGYNGERGAYLTAATIVRQMPSGLTGGRAKNGRKAREK